MKKYRRHTADVTADRLQNHYERWFDLMTEQERGQFEAVMEILGEMPDRPAAD